MATRVADADLVQQRRREHVLDVPRKGPGPHVLRPERSGGRPAPFGQRRHWPEMIAERREPRERLIVRTESLVEPHTPLILIVPLRRRTTVVVGGASSRRQRITVQKRERHRI